jgi:hypothetical protein
MNGKKFKVLVEKLGFLVNIIMDILQMVNSRIEGRLIGVLK